MKKKTKPAKSLKKEVADSYNSFKEFEGRRYTGMAIGRSHKWNYDKGVWKETKVTPDEWEIHYAVKKRRAGKAPEGSGAAVGTEYHWYILAHQNVTKLDANTYTTALTGMKFKLAHKRADNGKWSLSEKTQKKHLVKILQEVIANLEKEIEAPEIKPVKKAAAPAKKRKAAPVVKHPARPKRKAAVAA